MLDEYPLFYTTVYLENFLLSNRIGRKISNSMGESIIKGIQKKNSTLSLIWSHFHLL